jgi:hypothetical protein
MASTMIPLLSILATMTVASAAADAPDMNGNWFSLEKGSSLEFQPSNDAALHRSLGGGGTTAGSTSGYESQFVDGSETYYNDYAQAWRLLGFYTDCNAPHNNQNECSDRRQRHRQLNGGGNNAGETPACQRYLMWAAYVDLDYAGGGIGEYQFYDRHSQNWDKTSCVAKSGRCAKMDCHLKETNFQLLGFFKEPNYHEWMEQLFKVCS